MDIAQIPALRMHARRLHVTRAALGVAGGCVLVAIAAALGASARGEDETTAALLRATIVAAPLAAALYAWGLRPFERFARLLLVVGLVSFLTTLAESDDAT